MELQTGNVATNLQQNVWLTFALVIGISLKNSGNTIITLLIIPLARAICWNKLILSFLGITIWPYFCIFTDPSPFVEFFADSYREPPVCEPFTLIEGINKPLVGDAEGYTYSFCKGNKNGSKSWRCSRRHKGCKAYVVTMNNIIVRKQYHHNHW